jgi:hypothetical protein
MLKIVSYACILENSVATQVLKKCPAFCGSVPVHKGLPLDPVHHFNAFHIHFPGGPSVGIQRDLFDWVVPAAILYVFIMLHAQPILSSLI